MIHKFKSTGEFKIAGRGLVHTVQFEYDMPRKEVMNQNIEIDGRLYECTGIEQFATIGELGSDTLHKEECWSFSKRN